MSRALMTRSPPAGPATPKVGGAHRRILWQAGAARKVTATTLGATALFFAFSWLFPPVYVSEGAIELVASEAGRRTPGGAGAFAPLSPPTSAGALAPGLRGLASDRGVIEAVSAELGGVGNDADLKWVSRHLAIAFEPPDIVNVSFSAHSAHEAQRGCGRLAQKVLDRLHGFGAGSVKKPSAARKQARDELEQKLRQLAELASAHPEMSTAPASSAPSAPDPTLGLLERERERLERELAEATRRRAAEAQEPQAERNPYDDDPVTDDDLAALRRKIASVRAAISARQAGGGALDAGHGAQSPDGGVAKESDAGAELKTSFQRLVDEILDAERALGRDDGSEQGTAVAAADMGGTAVESRSGLFPGIDGRLSHAPSLPDQPSKPKRGWFTLLGAILGAALGAAWSLVILPPAPRGARGRVAPEPAPARAGSDTPAPAGSNATAPAGAGPPAPAADAVAEGATARAPSGPPNAPAAGSRRPAVAVHVGKTQPGIVDARTVLAQTGVLAPGTVPRGDRSPSEGGPTWIGGESARPAGARSSAAPPAEAAEGTALVPARHAMARTSVGRRVPSPDRVTVHAVFTGWAPNPVLALPAADPTALAGLCEKLSRTAAENLGYIAAFTSSRAHPKKSPICATVAVALAASKALRVLVVEGNFDHPEAGELLSAQPPPGAGFSQQLHRRLGEGTRRPWTVVECQRELHVLSEGLMRAPGLLNSLQFADAMAELRTEYDLLLIDGPPMESGADFRALEAVADGLLIIAAPGEAAPSARKVIARIDVPFSSST